MGFLYEIIDIPFTDDNPLEALLFERSYRCFFKYPLVLDLDYRLLFPLREEGVYDLSSVTISLRRDGKLQTTVMTELCDQSNGLFFSTPVSNGATIQVPPHVPNHIIRDQFLTFGEKEIFLWARKDSKVFTEENDQPFHPIPIPPTINQSFVTRRPPAPFVLADVGARERMLWDAGFHCFYNKPFDPAVDLAEELAVLEVDAIDDKRGPFFIKSVHVFEDYSHDYSFSLSKQMGTNAEGHDVENSKPVFCPPDTPIHLGAGQCLTVFEKQVRLWAHPLSKLFDY